jgi:hypothetical protein
VQSFQKHKHQKQATDISYSERRVHKCVGWH